MPALITHRLFGEESINRLPEGLVASGEERAAFLLANQGPDPFFFRFRTPSFRTCMELAQVMHRSRISRQFAALREGTSRLMDEDARLGRAFSLGLLSHYVLDRNAHPFVYEQQWGVMEADESLAGQGSAVHAIIESDLDVLMLQLKRDHATVRDYPPADELATSDHVNKVAGALMSHVAMKVYGLDVAASEYGGAVADMRLAYRTIEPSGSFTSRVHPMFAGLAHPVTAEPPRRAGNLDHKAWRNPFTDAASTESFPEVFARALDDYQVTAARFIEGVDMAEVTGHVNYSGRPLDAGEEFDREE